jgi:DNA-binding response OmpR family regulator
MRILYVEDDESNAEVVERMLLSVGHNCDRAQLGEQALSLAQDRAYDFILLDIMLPDIDGFEVMRRLRSAGVDTPFLIQSGLVDRESSFASLAFGTGEYLVKPFTQQELIGAMQAVLARAKLIASQNLDDPAADPLAGSDESDENRQRKCRRFKTVKEARIDYGTGIDCKILNLSHGGAALRLPANDLQVPPTFFLTLKSGETYHCRVCWREEAKIGVKYLDSAT